jgi:hypothetical protein
MGRDLSNNNRWCHGFVSRRMGSLLERGYMLPGGAPKGKCSIGCIMCIEYKLS